MYIGDLLYFPPVLLRISVVVVLVAGITVEGGNHLSILVRIVGRTLLDLGPDPAEGGGNLL